MLYLYSYFYSRVNVDFVDNDAAVIVELLIINIVANVQQLRCLEIRPFALHLLLNITQTAISK